MEPLNRVLCFLRKGTNRSLQRLTITMWYHGCLPITGPNNAPKPLIR